MNEERFFRIVATSKLDYSDCYDGGDTPSTESSLEVTNYDNPEDLLRALLSGDSWRYESLLEELGFIKKSSLTKKQQLELDAQLVLIRRETERSYADKIKVIDIEDVSLPYAFDPDSQSMGGLQHIERDAESFWRFAKEVRQQVRSWPDWKVRAAGSAFCVPQEDGQPASGARQRRVVRSEIGRDENNPLEG